jgi:3-deoxy-7-phosphoheptulonate synthase
MQNYDSVNIALTEKALTEKNLPINIMVDCSHANSGSDASLQPLVLENVSNQILEGNTSIVGVMLESHLESGNQKLGGNKSELEYGKSITDACIDWETTETALRNLRAKLASI